MYTKQELEANGGHTPDCEEFCSSSCPIGRERRAKANARAASAQALWTARGNLPAPEHNIVPVGGYSTRLWCTVHQAYADDESRARA